MAQKEGYEKRIANATLKLADYMVKHAVNNEFSMNFKDIMKALSLIKVMYQEALGRLMDMGFCQKVLRTKANPGPQSTNGTYFYTLNVENHPSKIPEEDMIALIEKRERKKQRARARIWKHLNLP